ncbi:tetratricopeptide repeat protein [Microbispora sp. NPDC004025]
MNVTRARRWGLTVAGVAVTVAGGVATNKVDGPGWAQISWYAGAMLCLVLGPWLTLKGSARPAAAPPASREAGASRVVGNIPRAPAAWQPRAEPMAALEGAGASSRSVSVSVLTGPRGAGKTQLAAAYARACAEREWPLVAWVHAESRGLLVSGLDTVARAIGIAVPEEDAEHGAQRLKDWLEARRERCLVVLDNLVDAEVAVPWLPAVGAAQVVVTSTRRAVEVLGAAVPVGMFTPEEAVAFLRERSGRRDEEGARRLAAELDGLPLALAQAAAVIRGQGLDYATYLERLRSVPLETMLPPIPADGYSHGAAQAALLSLNRLGRRRKTRTERGLLDLLAVLSPDGVPRSWLRRANTYMALVWFKGDASLQIDAALGVLGDSSLITMSVDGSTVGMHRVLQRVVCDVARQKGRLDQVLLSAAALVAACAPGSAGASADREAFVDQVEALRRHAFQEGVKEGTTTFIMTLQGRAGEYLEDAFDPKRAAALYEHALDGLERVLGPDHYDTLLARSLLGNALNESGDVAAAVPLLERAAADFERMQGPDHPDSLAAYSALARAYQSAGDLRRAIPLLERALADYERVLGPDDRNSIVSHNELARALVQAGQPERAIELHEKALAALTRVLGPDHRDTLLTRVELARAHARAGDPGRAIDLFKQSIADMVLHGPDDPVIQLAREELAKLSGEQVAGGEAEDGRGGSEGHDAAG